MTLIRLNRKSAPGILRTSDRLKLRREQRVESWAVAIFWVGLLFGCVLRCI